MKTIYIILIVLFILISDIVNQMITFNIVNNKIDKDKTKN